jgi:hypothetical protein
MAFFRYKAAAQAALKPGQRIQYIRNQGYRIMPAGGAAPVSPWAQLSPQAVETAANTRVDQQLEIQRLAIQRAREEAQRGAEARRAAVMGFGQAIMPMLQQVGPRMQEGYQQAGQSIAGLAGGFSEDMASRMQAAAQQNAQFAQSQGATGPNEGAVDTQQAKNVMFALGGAIPGQAHFEQGGAARAFGEALPGISALETQRQLQSQLGQEAEEDAKFIQEMSDLAAKRPELRAQILQELQNYELKKFEVRQSQEEMKLRQRAQRAAEMELGIDAAQAQQKIGIQAQNAQTSAARQSLAERKFQAELAKQRKAEAKSPDAPKVNVSLSRAMGYMVDNYGNPILRGGKRVPVPKTGSGSGGAKGNDRNKALQDRNKAINDSIKEIPKFLADHVYIPGTQTVRAEFKNPIRGAGGVPGRGKVNYSKVKARVMAMYWPQIQAHSTAAGRAALRTQFSKRVDQALRAVGITPSAPSTGATAR